LLDAELARQRGRPAIAAREELLVGQPQIAIHQRFVIRIQAPGPAHEVEWAERGLHGRASIARERRSAARGLAGSGRLDHAVAAFVLGAIQRTVCAKAATAWSRRP